MDGIGNGIVDFGDILRLSKQELDFEREDDIDPKKVEKDDADAQKTLRKSEEEVIKKQEEERRKKEEEERKKQEELEQPVVKADDLAYRRVINELAKRGVISDLKDIRFESEDGNEVSLDEMDLSDGDLFINVLSSILENQKDSILKDKIDVGSISEFTKKLIQADKSGANVLDILKQYDRMAAPIENLSLDNKQDQLRIIQHYINMLGLPKDEAEEFFKGITSKGDEYIEAKATKYKSELDKKMDEIIEKRTQDAERKRKEDAEQFKAYKKALKNAIQTQYQLNDTMVSKAMNFAINPSKENPNVTELNERVRAMLLTPELAPDLIMFLMDPDEFIKQKSNKRVSEEKRKVYKLISTSKKDRSRAPVDDDGNELRGLDIEQVTLKE